MIAFWFLEVSSLLFVLMLFTFFGSHKTPDFYPSSEERIDHAVSVPAYFPSAVFLGAKRALLNGLIIETARRWVSSCCVGYR
jgi:ABC-2 type transport system permease protein